MRKEISLLLIPLLLAFAACSDSDEPETGLEIISSVAEFSPEGGTGQVVFSAPAAATVKSTQEWCQVSLSGSTVTLTVEPNRDNLSRVSNVTITSGGEEKTVNVYQHGYAIVLGIVYFDLEWEAGSSVSTTLENASSTDILSHPDWVEAIVGDGTLTLRATESNPKLFERTGELILSAFGIRKTVRIVQQPQPVSYSAFLGDWTFQYASTSKGDPD
ncbi:MAG: BACON domain-containing protein [Rikenellaceae bacterium]|nr:BACON domain-containing protein [Rikenellaceae bacterium]